MKPRFGQEERGGTAVRPLNIEKQRLLRKGAKKTRRESGCVLRRETGPGAIPPQSAPGKDNQDVRRPILADPIFGLLRNPGRGRRFGRSKEDEER